MRSLYLTIILLSFGSLSFAVETFRPFTSNIVLPQRRVISPQHSPQVKLDNVDAHVEITGQLARTTLLIALSNPSNRQLEAEILLPVPNGAHVHGFDFQGAGSEPSARLLSKEEARKTYDAIVAKMRDPALLEFVDQQLLRSSVFPVPAHGTQKVKIVYESVLPREGKRIDYILPRSAAVDHHVPWDIQVQIFKPQDIASIYSPSHQFIKQQTPSYTHLHIKPEALKNPGAFMLSVFQQHSTPHLSYYLFPDPSIGGGYFMVLSTYHKKKPKQILPRCLQMVIDRSGSMHSGKIEQIQESCLQILAGLKNGEYINITVYNEYVDQFSEKPIQITDQSRKTLSAYIKSMRPQGGTNIHDALLNSLRQEPPQDCVPLVLFLTDGVATIGQRSEKVIRDLSNHANPHQYRIFSIGVGVDVNTALLQELSDRSRGRASFLGPNAELETSIAAIFEKLHAPILTDLNIAISDQQGALVKGRIHDYLPRPLPDLFNNEQLIIVGRYRGDQAFTFSLNSKQGSKITGLIDPKQAHVRNAFVARVWAQRQIAHLIDQLRDNGVDPQQAQQDPRNKEIIDEIIRLSTQFGILTEYTAFFVREGTQLNKPGQLYSTVRKNIEDRAWSVRSGAAAYNQNDNIKQARESERAQLSNSYMDKDLSIVHVQNGLRTIHQEACYQQNNRWVSSSYLQQEQQTIDQEIAFGSEEHIALAYQLAKQGRQALLAQDGCIVLRHADKNIQINNP